MMESVCVMKGLRISHIDELCKKNEIVTHVVVVLFEHPVPISPL